MCFSRRSHVEKEPAPKNISEIDPNRIIYCKTFSVHEGKADNTAVISVFGNVSMYLRKKMMMELYQIWLYRILVGTTGDMHILGGTDVTRRPPQPPLGGGGRNARVLSGTPASAEAIRHRRHVVLTHHRAAVNGQTSSTTAVKRWVRIGEGKGGDGSDEFRPESGFYVPVVNYDAKFNDRRDMNEFPSGKYACPVPACRVAVAPWLGRQPSTKAKWVRFRLVPLSDFRTSDLPDDAAGRRAFSVIILFPFLAFRRCSILASLQFSSALKTLVLKAAQTSPHSTSVHGTLHRNCSGPTGRVSGLFNRDDGGFATALTPCEPITILERGNSGLVRLLAYHRDEPGSIPGVVTSGFSHVAIVPDDAAVRRGFSEFLMFSPPLLIHSDAAPYSPRFTLIGSPWLEAHMLREYRLFRLDVRKSRGRKSVNIAGAKGSRFRAAPDCTAISGPSHFHLCFRPERGDVTGETRGWRSYGCGWSLKGSGKGGRCTRPDTRRRLGNIVLSMHITAREKWGRWLPEKRYKTATAVVLERCGLGRPRRHPDTARSISAGTPERGLASDWLFQATRGPLMARLSAGVQVFGHWLANGVPNFFWQVRPFFWRVQLESDLKRLLHVCILKGDTSRNQRNIAGIEAALRPWQLGRMIPLWSAIAFREMGEMKRDENGKQCRTTRAGKREIPKKTSRLAASSGMILTCENPGVTRHAETTVPVYYFMWDLAVGIAETCVLVSPVSLPRFLTLEAGIHATLKRMRYCTASPEKSTERQWQHTGLGQTFLQTINTPFLVSETGSSAHFLSPHPFSLAEGVVARTSTGRATPVDTASCLRNDAQKKHGSCSWRQEHCLVVSLPAITPISSAPFPRDSIHNCGLSASLLMPYTMRGLSGVYRPSQNASHVHVFCTSHTGSSRRRTEDSSSAMTIQAMVALGNLSDVHLPPRHFLPYGRPFPANVTLNPPKTYSEQDSLHPQLSPTMTDPNHGRVHPRLTPPKTNSTQDWLHPRLAPPKTEFTQDWLD
ncbi:hypothetical protein PR048_017729 [Dryococelus australis]|uniref:Uncharacterized protein n=1 Tax=Dryococelus australis TaxID=614101 RepID=A0ABQ9HAD6_9NEOP|nr:hypothetical protein PR048_017729 [Dryococelus australis]